MARLRHIFLAVAMVVVLLVLLVLSRLKIEEKQDEVLELSPIVSVEIEEPEEPESSQEVEQQLEIPEEMVPQPIQIELNPQLLETVNNELAVADAAVSQSIEVDLFSLEATRPVESAPVSSVQKPTVSARPLSKPKLAVSGEVKLSDLDRLPTCIRRGRFRWPREVRAAQVQAEVRIELSETGSARLLSIRSVSDEGIRAVLPGLVNASKFTVPTRSGKPVKVIFNWPITLDKR